MTLLSLAMPDASIILYLGAFGAFVNVFLQSYDIIWCRWHDCGRSSKNSTASHNQQGSNPLTS